jgi:predicted MFS family arabinose efflux permease
VGGIMDQTFGWSSIFLLLILIGSGVIIAIYFKLPETHLKENRQRISIIDTALQLIKDKKVITYGLIVAGCNGILFSFYAEGSFYMIELLELMPSTYGASFIGMSLAGVTGGFISRRMHNQHSSITILNRGLIIMVIGSSFFMITTIIFGMLGSIPKSLSITLTISSMMIIGLGCALAIPNSLSVALEDYKHAVGTASSLFGFFYYVVISLLTLGMGILHNGTLYPMPIYFTAIAVLMWIVFSLGITKKNNS